MIIKSSELEKRNCEGPHTQKETPVRTRKILHLINGEHFSGAERVQDLLAIQLGQFGYEVGFACLKSGKFPRVRQSVNAEIFEVNMSHKFDFRTVRKITQIVRNENYEAIHAHTPRSLLIGRLVAGRCKCPLIYHVHSPVGRDSERKIHNYVNTLFEKWSLKRVAKMICVSNSLMGYMSEIGHDPQKLVVVQNGVPVVSPLPERTSPQDPWTIGTMALFRPRKGTEVLLEAMAILCERGRKVRLRAVGPFESPEYKTEILFQAQKLGLEEAIDWVGFQKDINSQLQQMDLFVLPSLYGEGLPMVVLESMACGVPVVASRVEGIPEAIRDGVDGLIFEPGNPEDLADQLDAMIHSNDQWKTMSDNSLARQREFLSDVNMARKVAAIYDDVLG